VNENRRRGRGKLVLLVVVALLGVGAAMGYRFVFGRPSFDGNEVGRAEARMWQAYYANNKTQLGLQLVAMLRKQHGLSLLESKQIGELLAASAMKFRKAKGDYERVALGELTEAYRLIKDASGGTFDPEAAARAELAWWVARRTAGEDSAEQVGRRIEELYTILYGGNHPSFARAGYLRAQAAALRDAGRQNADWVAVEALLCQSYRELQKAF